MTEKELILNLKNQNTLPNAFKELVKQYKERLYWHIRKIVINHDDTDDVLQNTFIKVYKNIGNFKEESKLYSWMYRIATNEAITFINQRAKKSNSSTEEVQQSLLNNLEADNYFDGNAAQIKLQQAIATLPQKQQLVFNMKYFDNVKYQDMSEILETSVGALKSSYHIAVKKIEDFIKNN
ncbi:RNA polymerase sigma factor [Pseudofulvibacter geojedonensis]|uniref:RNA polymerase sigma factor n=1 Tax=Pseudofulvibacter geojedonensis TaxID=1123758 RepID=A0ABW3I005_9FLAO